MSPYTRRSTRWSAPADSDAQRLAHLRHLGFGTPTAADEDVVREFQSVAGVRETGTFDGATKDLLARLLAGEPLGEG